MDQEDFEDDSEELYPGELDEDEIAELDELLEDEEE